MTKETDPNYRRIQTFAGSYLSAALLGLLMAMCWVTEPPEGMVEEEGGSSCSCIDFGTAAYTNNQTIN